MSNLQEKKDTIINYTKAVSMQFKRIADCDHSSNTVKRMRKYADDGHLFSEKMLDVFKNYDDEESTEQQVQHESEADKPNEFNKSEDLKFVEEYRKNNIGRFIWEKCYKDGLQKEPPHFHRYKSSRTLKRAYARGTL